LTHRGPTFGRIVRSYTFVGILVLSLVCFGLVLARDLQTHHSKYTFLLFNLALSWFPMALSLTSVLTLNVGRRPLGLALLVQGVLWLLLYPNDSYLLTDFVHVFANTRYDSMPFGNMYLWFDLVLFFLYALCGLLMGYQSLRCIHDIMRRKFSDMLCWIFVVVISYLVAFGVYLGRMGRLNSWDAMFNPKSFIKPVFETFTFTSFQFIGLFGSFLVFIYLLFYLMTDRTAKTAVR